MKKQTGLSLIELLTGIIVGLIIVAGAIKTYTGSAKSGSDNIKLYELNQDLRSMMDMMVKKIRRAGFVTSSPTNLAMLQNNTLTQLNIEDITIKGASHPNACIAFMYNDKNIATPNFGFKVFLDTSFSPAKGVLRMLSNDSGSIACSNWPGQTITSQDVEITDLKFDLTEAALDVAQRKATPNIPPVTCKSCTDAKACTAPCPSSSPNISLIVRNVTITLTGALRDSKGDILPGTSQTVTDTVHIRNDQYCQNGYSKLLPAQCN